MLVLHSLPLEFPLAVAFAEQLLSWKSEDGEGRSEDEPDTVPASVLLQVVELLGEARALGEPGPGGAAGGGWGRRGGGAPRPPHLWFAGYFHYF